MKKNLNQNLGRRILSLVMVLLMAIPWVSTPALAASDWSALQISVSWSDGTNTQQSGPASPVSWAEGNVFWLTLPGGTPLNSLTLNISHPDHSDYTYAPNSGEPLGDISDASDLKSAAVYINAFDGSGAQVTEPSSPILLYISTKAAPVEPKPVPVPIIYKGDDEAILYQDNESVSLLPGQSKDVTVDKSKTFDGYEFNDSETKSASVGQDGTANPVVFMFAKKTAQPVSVSIIYQGSDGTILFQDNESLSLLPGQSKDVNVDKSKTFDGYVFDDSETKPASVSQDGTPNPAIFNFRKVDKVVVPIIYQGSDGTVLFQDNESVSLLPGQSKDVNVDKSKTFEGYVFNDSETKTASVSQDGTPNPAVFNFKKVDKVPVSIIYQGDDGAVLFQDNESVSLLPGQSKDVNVDKSKTFEGYVFNDSETKTASVSQDGTPNPAIFMFKKETPQQPVAVPVPIIYKAEDTGATLYEDDSLSLLPGATQDVHVDSTKTFAGYVFNDSETKTASVSQDGVAQPVVFMFKKETPQQPVAVPVPIIYKAEDTGATLYEDDSLSLLPGATQDVHVDSTKTFAGYVFNDSETKTASVSQDGVAQPVVFMFKKETPQQPVEVPVTIEYTKDGKFLTSTTKPIAVGSSNVPVKEDPNQTPAGYKLDGPNTVNVSVDANGVATPNKVTFNYIPNQVTPVTVQVTVNYSKDGSVFFSEQVPVTAPGRPVTPLNDKTPAEYKLEGAASVNVLVNDQGVASPNPVTFNYVSNVTETIPVGNPIDRWGVTKDKVNFRSSPATTGNNRIKELPLGTHVWMYEEQYDKDNKAWTHVKVDGQEGYIVTQYITMMTQAQSDGYQATLPSPMPTRSPAPTTQPTAVPQYTGYAITTKQVALRTDANNTDQSILATLPQNTLVRVTSQVNQGTVPWSMVETLDGLIGYVPDDSLRRINQEEAKFYIDQYNSAHPPVTPTPSPSPVQQHGYAATLGDNVPMRGAADPNSMLVNMLAKNTVVYVSGQEYLNGVAWHIVQYKGQWGYIRADQLRWLSQQETDAYLKSLNTPTPTPANTLPPLDQNSASSYGYVTNTSGSVNFRSAPGGSVISTLKKYAFALVLGSTQSGGKTWYKVNQAGREGYISGDFFHVLSLAELEDFLQSPEYAQGLTGNTGNNNNNNNSGNDNSEPPTSPEDMNVGTWTNPNTGLDATYEPFDPYTTPEPLPTPTASPTPEPLATFEPLPTEPPVETQSDSPSFVWVGLGVALLGGFGGLYAYALHKSNQRKAAARAAQRRASMQQNPQNGARPYARATNAPMVPPASGTQVRPGTPPTGAPRPQTPGSTASSSPYSQRPANAQPSGMAQRPPVTRPGQPGSSQPAMPGQQPGAYARPTAGTQQGTQSPASYRPDAQGNSAAPGGQAGSAQQSGASAGTSRQTRAARHAGNPTDQSTNTDTNENL